jgi:hypothetical protein
MKGLPDENLEDILAEEEQLGFMAVDRTSFGDEDIRNRFGYHKPANAAIAEMHRAIRIIFINTADTLDRILPEGRAKSVAFTKLEESCMWANKAIAEMSPVVDE